MTTLLRFDEAEHPRDEAEHPRDEKGRFTNKGNVSREVVKYDNGGSITANYPKATHEEKENISALKTFAKNGDEVILLNPINARNEKSPDCTINGTEWEVKTNYKNSVSAIDNAVRSCKGQSKNLILNITSDITDKDVFSGIKGRIKRTDIENVIVERNGEIVSEFKRGDFE